ncbi:hypothetical protein [Sphaerotilus sp.]|jgi:hypothetical protein|uniref:hypothetical protein n=1 Tax=Sphaerotilus sp. TaxID=2093942 RepID=UPI00286DB17F|nr:hypothetical protein [Sphaerotilus sp.]
MRPILHHQLAQTDTLLVDLGRLLTRYNTGDGEVDSAVSSLLASAAALYERQGRHDLQARFLAMGAELVTARRGTDPATLEPMRPRREGVRRTVFRVLTAAEAQIGTDYRQTLSKLDALREQLGALLATGLERGLLQPLLGSGPPDQPTLQAIWAALTRDTGTGGAALRINLQYAVYDVLLLIDDLLAPLLRPAAPG